MKEFDVSMLNIPDTIVSDADTAKTIVDGVYQSNDKMWQLISMMEQHIDGRRPVDQEKLKESGRSWQSNTNYGKARSRIEGVVSENVDSVLSALLLMGVTFKPNDDKVEKDEDLAFLMQPDLRDYAGSCIEAALNDLVDEDERTLPYINMLEYNTTNWGWTVSVRDINHDYLGNAQHVRSIGFIEKARPEQVGDFVCFDTLNGRDLWKRYIETIKSENKALMPNCEPPSHKAPNSWIIEGLEEALFYAYEGQFESDEKHNGALFSFRDQILPEFMKSSGLAIAKTEKINVSKIYTFEFESNTVTITWVAYGNGWKGGYLYENGPIGRFPGKSDSAYPRGVTVTGQSPKHLLYQRTVKFKSKSEIMDLLFDTGFSTSGFLQDIRGLARYAVEDGIAHNKLRNDLMDKMRIAGCLAIEKRNNLRGGTGPKLAPMAGLLVMDPEYAFTATQPKVDLSNQVTMLTIQEREYSRETSNHNPEVSNKLTSRPVSREVEEVSGEVRRTRGTKLNIKLRCYAGVFTGILRAMAHNLGDPAESSLKQNPEAKRGFDIFTEKLKASLAILNIDSDAKLKKLLDRVDRISLENVLGDPEAIAEQISMAESPYHRVKFSRMLMIARGFSRRDVAQRWPLMEMPTNMNDEWMAALENAAFETTSEVVFSPSHHHISHLNIHFPKAFGLLEQIQQAPDPVPLFNWLNRLTEHIGFHVDSVLKTKYLVEETKLKYLKSYKELLLAIAQIKKQIEAMARKLAEQQQQAQAQQPQVDPETQAKIENDRIKLQENMRLKEEASKWRAGEKQKDNELRRQQQQETHQDKMQKSRELADLKKELELIKASTKMATA